MNKISLTPAGRVVVFLVILAILATVGYFYGLFDNFLGKGKLNTDNTGLTLSSKETMHISLDEWIGWKPILDANGGTTTQPGSIYGKLGLKLNIHIINDGSQSSTALIKGDIAGAGYTVNRFAFLYPKFIDNRVPVKMVYIVNNSSGGDGIIAKAGINRIEDLVGKKIGVPRFSEAQTLVEWLLSKSSLTDAQVNGLRRSFVYFNTPDDAAKACFSGQLDAAATWQPYLSQATTTTSMHVLFSTKEATNLVLDGIIFRQDYINANPEKIKLFIEGALKAASLYTTSFTPIKNTMPLFATETDSNIKAMTEDATLLDHAANVESGNGIVQTLYTDMANIWKALGEKADPEAFNTVFDFSLLKSLEDKFPASNQGSKLAFTEEQRDAAQAQGNEQALLSQKLTINFALGSAAIDQESFGTLNSFAKTAKLLNKVIIQIEGNTDNIGQASTNQDLSYRRAKTAATYLIYQGIDASRFVIVGNGSNKPVAGNGTAAGRAQNRRTDVYFKVVQ